MFDQETAAKLRSAPEIDDLDPNSIPQLLTKHYVKLVSRRLGGETDGQDEKWNIGKIADAYEIIALAAGDQPFRRSAAFVAATAQLLISRENQALGSKANITRDSADGALTACLLFLIAEQHADASEAANHIPRATENTEESIELSERILLLSKGKLNEILGRPAAQVNPDQLEQSLESRALALLTNKLSEGIQMLAAEILSGANNNDTSEQVFLDVQNHSKPTYIKVIDTDIECGGYAGPNHIATLLIAARGTLLRHSLAKITSPPSSNPTKWATWLEHRARKSPYLWPNHLDLIGRNFHYRGTSAVLVLPTGSGKTTVSVLKIAAAITSGDGVIFLAPTHALVEQLTEDLKSIFPADVVETVVSDDIALEEGEEQAKKAAIHVMTPESCLAALAHSPDRFSSVGLLVFDECHLLAPANDRARRAIDGMLCILAFVKASPTADLLLMSAMLENGEDLSNWIKELTGSHCESIDLLWKPSRQARGVVIYDHTELSTAKQKAINAQAQVDREKKRRAEDLGVKANKELRAVPNALWGLEHNWLAAPNDRNNFFIQPLLSEQVQLKGSKKYGPIQLTPNANTVAARVAMEAASAGLKTIIFVNNRQHAVKTAREISQKLPKTNTRELEPERYEALKCELGSIAHSLLDELSGAVPHHASMLRIERDIAERLYQNPIGAKVIVATPTLAQGLNLPAQLAILAGDKRIDENQRRTSLAAHEILNAAARAGRAGHLANGAVLLIPEPILTFKNKDNLSNDAVQKLQALLPADDRCVTVTDPLELILDKLSLNQEAHDAETEYVINRMAALELVDEDQNPLSPFDIKKSFAAYTHRRRGESDSFDEKLNILYERVSNIVQSDADRILASLSSRTGLPFSLLSDLRARLESSTDQIPRDVLGWLIWILLWLEEDQNASNYLLGESSDAICSIVGDVEGPHLLGRAARSILPAMEQWLKGVPLNEIERTLGGDPDSKKITEKICPRARELVTTVMNRGISYTATVVSMVASTLPLSDDDEYLKNILEAMPTALRKGYDSIEKVRFSYKRRDLFSRVAVHQEFAKQEAEFWGG